MNKKRLMKILDEYYEVSRHEQNRAMIEILEAILEDEYDQDLGKTESSEDSNNTE
jgi:hypothetical protein